VHRRNTRGLLVAGRVGIGPRVARAVLGGDASEAFSREVRCVGRAPEFAVGHDPKSKTLLQSDECADGLVFRLAQPGVRQAAGRMVGTRRKKTADVLGAEWRMQ